MYSKPNNESGAVGMLVLTVLLLAGVGLGVYLVQTRTNLNPFAQTFDPNRIDITSSVLTEHFRLQNPKTDMEFYFNPFGESWINKGPSNPDIPAVMTGAFDRTRGSSVDRPARQLQFNRFLPEYFSADPWNIYPKKDVTYYLSLEEGYKKLLTNANTNVTFFTAGYGGRSSYKLRPEMLAQKIVNSEIKKINPALETASYYVINFIEEPDMAGYDLPESGFVHRRGSDPSVTANRLIAAPFESQYIIDVTNPQAQDHIADGIAEAMADNGLDIVLIDFAGITIPPALLNGVPKDSAQGYPPEFLQNYAQGNLQTLQKIKQRLNALGKEVLFNPYQPDVLNDTRLAEVTNLLNATDGSYWEDPFRVANRDYFLSEGPDYYYDRLEKMFDKAAELNKKLVIESNSMVDFARNITCPPKPGTSEMNPKYCVYDQTYEQALSQLGFEGVLKEEQRISRLSLGMFLLFMNNSQNQVFKYHTLMEEFDYETSEPFFADWDLKVGSPIEKKQKVMNNIYKREYSNALVFVNYSDQSYTVTAAQLKCSDYYQSVCQKTPYLTAEGVPVTEHTLAPLSAMIFIKDTILKPYNPSFETVWNWKPNQNQWGELDYTHAYSGERSLKISSGITGSVGLSQKFTFKPNTTYTWSAFVKTENNRNPYTVAAMVPGGVTTTHNTMEARFVHDPLLPVGTHDWRKISMQFTAQQGGAGNIYAVIQGGSDGTVWFDNVQVVEGAQDLNPVELFSLNDKTLAYCTEVNMPRIHLEWAPLPGASEYRIYIREESDPGSFRLITATTGTGFNAETQHNLTSGKRYGFLVAANTASGIKYANATWSDQAIGWLTFPACSSSTPPVVSSSSPSPAVGVSSTPGRRPGDVDGNNLVDIFDYNQAVSDFGKTGSGIASDLNNNGSVDIFDYNLVVSNFGL